MAERISPAPGLAFTRVADEGIVLDETGGQVHVLNAAAAQVWEMLESGVGLDEIVTALATGSDANPSQVRVDLLELLGEFAELGLVAGPQPAA